MLSLDCLSIGYICNGCGSTLTSLRDTVVSSCNDLFLAWTHQQIFASLDYYLPCYNSLSTLPRLYQCPFVSLLSFLIRTSLRQKVVTHHKDKRFHSYCPRKDVSVDIYHNILFSVVADQPSNIYITSTNYNLDSFSYPSTPAFSDSKLLYTDIFTISSILSSSPEVFPSHCSTIQDEEKYWT